MESEALGKNGGGVAQLSEADERASLARPREVHLESEASTGATVKVGSG